jgi:hypothetical protein
MNKIVQIKIFNDLLDQMFGYLEASFPDFKSELILTRSTTEFIRNSNPRLVVEQFMGIVLPYKAHIFDCNEDFFLNFEKNVGKKTITSDNLLRGMRIKSMWLSPDTTDLQKAYIWRYFQQLIKAGLKVMQ